MPRFGGGQPGAPEPPRTRVALLLPLTGPQAPLGRAMQQAAELALFENGSPDVDFLPRDTGGTTAGAAEAARRAVADGARLIVGPLTAAETSAASVAARGGSVPMLAFTNDSAQGGPGVWILGVTPEQQVRRVVGAAISGGARRLGMAGPDNAFGRAMASALRQAAEQAQLPPPVVVLHAPRADAGRVANDLGQQGAGGLDAVLLAEAGATARGIAAQLPNAGLTIPPLRLLGHALWAQEPGLGGEANLVGALFAAPDPQARAAFEARYAAAYGERPPRLVSVAYDAAALAARAVASGRGQPRIESGESIAGADGPLRLAPNGQVERGLALFSVDAAGEPTLVDAAPRPGLFGF